MKFAHEAAPDRRYTVQPPPTATLRIRSRCIAFSAALVHQSLLPRVLLAIYSAKVSHAQLPDIPLRSDTQALHLIASIPLIQRKEKHRSREEKSTFTQWFSSVYVRGLKDQARKP